MIKTFSNLAKTHYQKGMCLKFPNFVTELIFGQKCIILLRQNIQYTTKFNGMYGTRWILLVLPLNKISWELQFL